MKQFNFIIFSLLILLLWNEVNANKSDFNWINCILLYVVLPIVMIIFILMRFSRKIKRYTDLKSPLEKIENQQIHNNECFQLYTDMSHEQCTNLSLILDPKDEIRNADDIQLGEGEMADNRIGTDTERNECELRADENNDVKEKKYQLSKLDQEFLTKLKQFVLDNYSNPRFGMPFIADNFNMSNSSLYRKINILTGTTPIKYIRNIRLQRSCDLLDDGYSISEAAYDCGFNDLAYFRSCFREFIGMSPSAYKKSKRIIRC